MEAVCCDESGVPVFEMPRHSRIYCRLGPNFIKDWPLSGALRRRSELFNFRSCRRVCRQLKSRHAEARKNRSPRCLHGTTPVLRTSRNDHHIALAADPLFGAEAELHLALEHPHDLLIWVTVRLDMDTDPDAPPYNHPLVARKNAAADLFADLLLK